MSFKNKNIIIKTRGPVDRWSDFKGTWQEYLAYLDQKDALSPNFIKQGDKYILRY